MKSRTTLFALTIAALCHGGAFAQQADQDEAGSSERQWLLKFAGEWTLTSESVAAGETTKLQGRMTSRMLGSHWLVSDWSVEVDGEDLTAVQTLGFDKEKGAFIATWIDSVSDHMWQITGKIENEKLVLDAQGPSCFEEGKQTKYRDVYEFNDEGRIIQTSSAINPEGEWVQLARNVYQRIE